MNNANTIERMTKLLKETQIGTLELFESVEKHSYVLKNLYDNDEYNEKINYLLSNITFLATSSEIRKQFSLFVKFINYARVCSKIKLTRGQMLNLLQKHYFDGLVADYVFTDFLLYVWEAKYDNLSIDQLSKFILNFFGDVLLDLSFKFSRDTLLMLDSIDPLSMSMNQISKYIKDIYNCVPDDKISVINKEIDIIINKFTRTYVTEIEPENYNIEDKK